MSNEALREYLMEYKLDYTCKIFVMRFIPRLQQLFQSRRVGGGGESMCVCVNQWEGVLDAFEVTWPIA